MNWFFVFGKEICNALKMHSNRSVYRSTLNCRLPNKKQNSIEKNICLSNNNANGNGNNNNGKPTESVHMVPSTPTRPKKDVRMIIKVVFFVSQFVFVNKQCFVCTCTNTHTRARHTHTSQRLCISLLEICVLSTSHMLFVQWWPIWYILSN